MLRHPAPAGIITLRTCIGWQAQWISGLAGVPLEADGMPGVLAQAYLAQGAGQYRCACSTIVLAFQALGSVKHQNILHLTFLILGEFCLYCHKCFPGQLI